jgi:hypothetical protein
VQQRYTASCQGIEIFYEEIRIFEIAQQRYIGDDPDCEDTLFGERGLFEVLVEGITYDIVEEHGGQNDREVCNVPPAVKEKGSKDKEAFCGSGQPQAVEIEIPEKYDRKKGKDKNIGVEKQTGTFLIDITRLCMHSITVV